MIDLVGIRLSLGRVGMRSTFLPDMASIQLAAARQAAGEAAKSVHSFEWPLSALIMSVCALESFVNQLAFFIVEVGKHEDAGLAYPPPEMVSNLFAFEKTTELTEKWAMVGGFLCGSTWPPACWNEFIDLVVVHNQFLHFKITEYEQVIPPAPKPPKIVRSLPANFEPRDGAYSSPSNPYTEAR